MAQAIALFTTPLITRLYSPDNFGVYSLLFSIIGILASIGTLRYEVVIPIAKTDKIAQYVMELSIIILVSYTTLLAITISIFGNALVAFFQAELLITYLWIIPVICFLIGLYNLFTYWAVRKKGFKILTTTKFTQSITSSAIKIILGFTGFTGYGLIIGGASEQSAGIFTLYRSIKKYKIRLFNNFSYKRLLVVGRKYKNFPIYQSGSQLLLSFGPRLPLFFIAALFGVKTLGFFALASAIISAPINLLGNSISQVYFAEIAQYGKVNPDKIYKLTIQIIKKLALLIIPAIAIILLFGTALFEFAFGDKWGDAGIIAKCLIFLIAAKFIASPVMHVLNVLEKQSLQLGINILRVIIISASFIICEFLELSSFMTILIYSITLTIFYLLTISKIIFFLRRENFKLKN